MRGCWFRSAKEKKLQDIKTSQTQDEGEVYNKSKISDLHVWVDEGAICSVGEHMN